MERRFNSELGHAIASTPNTGWMQECGHGRKGGVAALGTEVNHRGVSLLQCEPPAYE
jgi:hypothetical protein